MPAPPHLTPAQLAKAAERRAAKEAKRAAQAAGLIELSEDQKREKERARFLVRGWTGANADAASTDGASGGRGRRGIRIVSWNILAQSLIRRELFPGSDCLRWPDRKAMLAAEMAHYGNNADILCLQECDRLKDLMHTLPFDSCVQGRGRNKQHGLVIMYREDRMDFVASKLVHLDEEFLSGPLPLSGKSEEADDQDLGEGEKRRRRGGSRQTKNVGLMVALGDKRADVADAGGRDGGGDGHVQAQGAGERAKGKGVIVATTHLFWHPKYQYERIRQLIILTRAIRAFQTEHGLQNWPVVLAGDFNTSPCEVPYQLLVSPHIHLPESAKAAVEDSRLVHDSVDKVGPLAERFLSSRTDSQVGTGEVNGDASSDSTAAATAETTQFSATASTAPSANGTGANTPTATATSSAGANGKPNPTEKEEEGEGELPDSNETSIANTRPPNSDGSDGIWTVAELQSELQRLLKGGCTSAYTSAEEGAAVPPATLRSNAASAATIDEGAASTGIRTKGQDDAKETRQEWDGPQTFEQRGGFEKADGIRWEMNGLKGKGEPGYTCYTGLFQLTLDYLLRLPAHPDATAPPDVKVTSLLQPPAEEALKGGLPRMGVSASDHIAVGAEFTW